MVTQDPGMANTDTWAAKQQSLESYHMVRRASNFAVQELASCVMKRIRIHRALAGYERIGASGNCEYS